MQHFSSRKIIHIDMDCFYAAIEERDNPELRGKPVGVGGSSRRSVLATANYEARKFGCRSAMPVFMALEKCPDLLIVPARFDIYKRDSLQIRSIFSRFTTLIEPLSLDEAFLDVTHNPEPGTIIASRIRQMIREETGLTASAGIAPNKLIAKIASDWRKPDGQFTVSPANAAEFMRDLPMKKISGVGGKMAEKLASMGIETCGQYRKIDKFEWARRLGGFGAELYERSWGRDERAVSPDSPRKSLSIENTFSENLHTVETLWREMKLLLDELEEKLTSRHGERQIRALVVKLKFSDFRRTTAERAGQTMDFRIFRELLAEANARSEDKPVRLLGVGVRFHDIPGVEQLELF
ncbi:DNA polymerase IV [Luteolibacter algae]|uniref:DNA polymerase IV n=1 Tax=Luteolibacter algae TaxID=454151 RepID=A0ABW5D1X1_9BACT